MTQNYGTSLWMALIFSKILQRAPQNLLGPARRASTRWWHAARPRREPSTWDHQLNLRGMSFLKANSDPLRWELQQEQVQSDSCSLNKYMLINKNFVRRQVCACPVLVFASSLMRTSHVPININSQGLNTLRAGSVWPTILAPACACWLCLFIKRKLL